MAIMIWGRRIYRQGGLSYELLDLNLDCLRIFRLPLCKLYLICKETNFIPLITEIVKTRDGSLTS